MASAPNQPAPKNHVRTPATMLAFLDYCCARKRRLWLIHARPVSKKRGDGGDQKKEVSERETKELNALHALSAFKNNNMSVVTLRAYYQDCLNLAEALAQVPKSEPLTPPNPNRYTDRALHNHIAAAEEDTRSDPGVYKHDYAVFAKNRNTSIFKWSLLKVQDNQLPTDQTTCLHLTRRAVTQLLGMHTEHTRPGIDLDDYNIQEYINYLDSLKDKNKEREEKSLATVSGHLGSARKRKADQREAAGSSSPSPPPGSQGASSSSAAPSGTQRPSTGSLLERFDLDALTSGMRARSEARAAGRLKEEQIQFLPMLQTLKSFTDKTAFDRLLDDLGIDIESAPAATAGILSSLSKEHKVNIKRFLKPAVADRFAALFETR